MAEPSIPADIRKMSFEQALEELKQIVERLEQGQGELDQAIEAYQRGALLKQHCEAKLRDAEQKIAKISLGADGSVGAEDLDLE
ncbi:MAG: exodeoxyribonuclease VII small subunit [Kiloniellales bacterium]|nr:exodeoxyribonuclease VII small subunit [Kiloniellales bacterium]